MNSSRKRKAARVPCITRVNHPSSQAYRSTMTMSRTGNTLTCPAGGFERCPLEITRRTSSLGVGFYTMTIGRNNDSYYLVAAGVNRWTSW
jgi:hypothetical protein